VVFVREYYPRQLAAPARPIRQLKFGRQGLGYRQNFFDMAVDYLAACFHCDPLPTFQFK
jgi:hypothetical protein